MVIFATCQRSYGKVMFFQVCVCSHGGSVYAWFHVPSRVGGYAWFHMPSSRVISMPGLVSFLGVWALLVPGPFWEPQKVHLGRYISLGKYTPWKVHPLEGTPPGRYTPWN